MELFKRILFGLLCSIIALCIGASIYLLEYKIKENRNKNKSAESVAFETVTLSPTISPTPGSDTVPESDTLVITTDVVNLRESPTTESAVINKVPKDTVLNLIYTDNEWAFVTYGGQQVYVSADYITEYTQP